MDINKVISRAKIGIMQTPDSVFLSTVVMSLKTEVSDRLKTAGTDGKTLIINPDFFGKLSLPQQVFVLCHEALHVAYMHMLRLDGRDHKLFNIACDYVINGFLRDRKFTLIDGIYVDRRFDGMSAEQVYDILLKEKPDTSDFECDIMPPSNGKGEEDQDQSSDAKQKAREQAEREIQAIVARASLQSELSGQGGSDIPSEIKRRLSDLLKPKVNWKKALARFLQSLAKSDYSYKKFNRKLLAETGLYFPTLVSEGNLSRVDFAVDVSGSVTDRVCTQFCSEMYAVLQHHAPDEMGVMQFDHEVQQTNVLKSFRDILKLKFVGGGGTLISPVFEAFKKSPAKALIILTDGHIWSRDRIQKVDNRPVIWCIYNNPNFTAPFGKVIHITL